MFAAQSFTSNHTTATPAQVWARAIDIKTTTG
jgi:hypothetical protein